MSANNQMFNEFVPSEVGPSTSSALPPTEIDGGGADIDLEAPKEEKHPPSRNPTPRLPPTLKTQKNYLHTQSLVDIQLAKFCGEIAIKQFNGYKAKGLHLPIVSFVDQVMNVVKILAVVRVILVELGLSEDTYIYLQTAAEYLGYFAPLSKEAKAAKIDIPNGEFHLLLFKLIDPGYSYHVGRRVSRFIDKAFGTPKKKECTSGLCNLSPEAQKTIRYYCTCEVSKYQKKAERAAGQEQPPAFTMGPPSVRPS
ncbi:uncharacterized protein DFL_004431 [Arthrobotrys flagrans]|uniref:Uncharacterized protein n=1 Tax=Arthrobotrys flagrans TaxID=97331 RepID=A0A437A564_ARTFL|nr:hypothetical protein DFL_004431 [Arthrobotrys flagrans]